MSTSISNTLFFLWLGGVMSYCSVRLAMSTKSNFISCYRTHSVQFYVMITTLAFCLGATIYQ